MGRDALMNKSFYEFYTKRQQYEILPISYQQKFLMLTFERDLIRWKAEKVQSLSVLT